MHNGEVQRNKTVLILYPWGIDSVIAKNIGAGMRVGLLAEFLRDKGFTVTVVSTGRSQRAIDMQDISYREVRYPTNPLLFVSYASLVVVSRILRWHALQAWLYYAYCQFDKKFVRQIWNHVEKAQTILLEYPFWSRLTEQKRQQTIMTDHDVIATSWTKKGPPQLNSLLFKNLLTKEIRAMARVARTVFVADSDRDFFVVNGVKPELTSVITNPIIIPEVGSVASQPVQHELTFKGATFKCGALFVGSGWYPNREAAQAITKIIAPACPDVTFFIAGDCSLWVKNPPPNVRLLGVLPAEDLSAIYRLVTFALIPIEWGTGSSLKAVEAMANGKVIVSTPVGVRGLNFKDDEHGVICPNIVDFPRKISELLTNAVSREQLALNAFKLAKQYDYRVVFERYLELINELPVGR